MAMDFEAVDDPLGARDDFETRNRTAEMSEAEQYIAVPEIDEFKKA